MLDITKYAYPRVYDMAAATDRSIYLISNTYKPYWSGSQVVITKCSSDGEELWTNAIGGFDNKAVITGAMVNPSNNSIDGFIKTIDLDGNELWPMSYSDGNTCFLFSSPYDALTVAGYSIDANSNVKEVIAKYDNDGKLAASTSSSAIYNPRADYTLYKRIKPYLRDDYIYTTCTCL